MAHTNTYTYTRRPPVRPISGAFDDTQNGAKRAIEWADAHFHASYQVLCRASVLGFALRIESESARRFTPLLLCKRLVWSVQVCFGLNLRTLIAFKLPAVVVFAVVLLLRCDQVYTNLRAVFAQLRRGLPRLPCLLTTDGLCLSLWQPLSSPSSRGSCLLGCTSFATRTRTSGRKLKRRDSMIR